MERNEKLTLISFFVVLGAELLKFPAIYFIGGLLLPGLLGLIAFGYTISGLWFSFKVIKEKKSAFGIIFFVLFLVYLIFSIIFQYYFGF